MTNFEYFKDDIKKIINDGKCITPTLSGNISSCFDTDCRQCQFNTSLNNCSYLLIKWLYEEHVEKKPKLTKKERLFCELIETGWIVRDPNGSLWYSTKGPRKGSNSWEIWNVEGGAFGNVMRLGTIESSAYSFITKDLKFHFIDWKDDEPWSIEELLKLETEAE